MFNTAMFHTLLLANFQHFLTETHPLQIWRSMLQRKHIGLHIEKRISTVQTNNNLILTVHGF